MSEFNQSEWFSAVYLAKSCLELKARSDFQITDKMLKQTAFDLLQGLIDRAEGKKPTLSENARTVIALINSEAVIDIAKNGGGLQ